MFAGCIEFASHDIHNIDSGVANSLESQALKSIGLAEIPFDDSELWREKNENYYLVLVQQRQWNTAESSKEQGIVRDPDSGAMILSWSRIDNRDELAEDLNDLNRVRANTDAGLILACWNKWGESVCEHLVGDFTFAIYEPEKKTFFLGRDHLGIRPLYFYQDGTRFVFATSLSILTGCESLNLEYSEEWLARYILGCSPDWVLTPYKHIEKLPPANYLLYKPGATDTAKYHINQKQYFEFSVASDLTLESDKAYVDEYRRLFSQAVKARLRSDYPIASELSGGLDSSSVTAMAASQMKTPTDTLVTYAAARLQDEPASIEAVNRSANIENALVVGRSELQSINFSVSEAEFFASVATPVEHDNALAHAYFYQNAKEKGIRTLLSGFGGDEFTTTYASLGLVEFWQKGQYLKWLSRLRGNGLTSKLRGIKWLYRYFRYGGCSATSQRLLSAASMRWSIQPLLTKIAAKYDLQSKNRQAESYDRGYSSINAFTLGNRWSPVMTARLENCSLMAARYRLEYRWPLLDIRLLRFFLSVPAEQKLGPSGLGRYLHRRAVADLLPEEIIWRDKSMGQPLSDTPDNTQPFETSAVKGGDKISDLIGGTELEKIIDKDQYLSLMQSISQKGHLRLIESGLVRRTERLARWMRQRVETQSRNEQT